MNLQVCASHCNKNDAAVAFAVSISILLFWTDIQFTISLSVQAHGSIEVFTQVQFKVVTLVICQWRKSIVQSREAHNSSDTSPTASVMTAATIEKLKEKKGSSLAVVKKYLAVHRMVVDDALIRNILNVPAANKTIVHTKGSVNRSRKRQFEEND